MCVRKVKFSLKGEDFHHTYVFLEKINFGYHFHDFKSEVLSAETLSSTPF